MASMSDIAFLLIIFFMISSVFIFNEGLHLTLPDNSKKPQIVSSKNILTISLLQKEKTILNKKEVDDGEIKEILHKMKLKNPNISILLKIEKDVIYSKAIKMIDCIKSAKITNFSLKMI